MTGYTRTRTKSLQPANQPPKNCSAVYKLPEEDVFASQKARIS